MVVVMHVPVILADLWFADQMPMVRGSSTVSLHGVLVVPSPKHLVSMPVCPNLPPGFVK